MPKEKSAGAVIFRREKGENYYLLLHYKSGHWDFPKGHIENKESDKDTVKREVEEETGIKDIIISDSFKEQIKYFFRKSYNFKKEEKDKAPWVFKIVVFYLAETKTKDVSISFEHTGYKWLRYDEALKQLTHKNAKRVLKKANEFFVFKKGL
ncbi:MAG: NUDIX domain-containing protein [Candidatus Pacebacteria bacterium]|nr:NUDIX domain-containing protein [Candidatus Paceibacterota bacterium]